MRPGGWSERTVRPEEEGKTVAEMLAAWLRLPDGELRALARGGGIRLNRRGASLSRPVRTGDVLAVRTSGPEAGQGSAGLQPVPVALDVIHEDADLVVVNKPAGMLVHPVVPDDLRTVANGLAHHFLQRGEEADVHPVHRLDRGTSGLVMVAKSPAAHRRLALQLRARTLRREYLALVRGTVAESEGVIDAPIGRDPERPALRAVHPGGQPARTRFRVVERYARATLLRLELETGRTHQIRVHLAHRGHPVLGDPAYGAGAADGIARQALHAARLAWAHPGTGAPCGCEAPLPPEMALLRSALAGAGADGSPVR